MCVLYVRLAWVGGWVSRRVGVEGLSISLALLWTRVDSLLLFLPGYTTD